MTTQAAFFPLSLQILFDHNACPTRYGSLSFFDAETTNPRPVYKDATLETPHPTPVKTDYYGRIPAIWVDVGNYKSVLADSVGAQIAVIDDMPGGVAITPPATMTQPIQTGMLIAAHSDDSFDGWLPCNGRTIGNDGSGASARANADCSPLFIKLWNQDPSLVVNNGGRGQNATQDFAAGKTITLPDYRGRVPAGVDQMGGDALAGVITAATLPAGASADAIGTALGSEAIALSQAQLPAVSPAITLDGGQPGGAHPHTGTTDNPGNHSHGGSTVDAGAHAHTYNVTQVGSLPVSTTNSNNFANAGTTPSTTSPAGDHVHGINADGAHTHAVTIASSGAHTHAAAIAPLGSGSSHSNMQPTVLVYWNIKL